MSELGRWYNPYKISFTFAQVTWVLRNIMEMGMIMSLLMMINNC